MTAFVASNGTLNYFDAYTGGSVVAALDTYADEYTIKSKATGNPINIAGYGFLMTLDTVKAPTDATTNVYQLIGTIIDAAAGRVEFAPSPLQADRVGGFFFDVQMTDGAGRKRTIDYGKYTYKQDITKT